MWEILTFAGFVWPCSIPLLEGFLSSSGSGHRPSAEGLRGVVDSNLRGHLVQGWNRRWSSNAYCKIFQTVHSLIYECWTDITALDDVSGTLESWLDFEHIAYVTVVVREGSQEPVTVTSKIGRELLHISSVSLPGMELIYFTTLETCLDICRPC